MKHSMAEKALSTLRQQHMNASRYIAMLDNTIEDLSGSQKLTEAEVDCIMELRGEQAVKGLEAQLRLWKRYLGKDKDLLVSLNGSLGSPLQLWHTSLHSLLASIPILMM